MGDRANVLVQEEGGGKLYLYTHWNGTELPTVVAKALDRARDRWNDESYLARVIFTEMIRDDDFDVTTGFGISTYQNDQNHEDIVVDIESQTIRDQLGVESSFEDFVTRTLGVTAR